MSLMGAAANLFVPGGLGIDGVRIVHFRRKTDVVALTSTIVVDRLLGLLGLASLAFAFGLPILIDWEVKVSLSQTHVLRILYVCRFVSH